MQNKQTDILEKYETFERYLRQKDPAFLEFLKRNKAELVGIHPFR